MGDTILPVRVQNVIDMEIVRLNVWSIKFTATNIRLEGFVRNEEGTMLQKVCSENICKRMNATMLFDVSGKFYELAGQIDREFQIKHGMPGRVVDEFLNGFPENWAFLIGTCLTTEQRSVLRPIQAAPVQPLRPKEPIVTLADETELTGDRTMAKMETEKERRAKQREEQRKLEKEREEEAVAERKDKEKREREEAERKRKEEEDAANYTIRAPNPLGNEAITPIRFHRGKGGGPRFFNVFDKTPKATSSAPLASSTPQARPPVRKEPEQPVSSKPVERPVAFASDADLFAVPRLPAKGPTTSSSSAGAPLQDDFDFLDEMDTLFDTAKIEKTPVMDTRRKPIIRRFEHRSYSPQHGQSSSSQAYEMDYNDRREPYYHDRYEDDRSRVSRRDFGGDASRMSRKRGYYQSPENRDRDEYEDRRRREHESRYSQQIYSREFEMNGWPRRETSSSSGRSVRFDDDYHYSDRHRNPRDKTRDERDREMYERQKLKEITRREKELEAKLKSRKVSRSSEESADDSMDMAEEWERENQEMLDNSMMMMPDRKSSRKQKVVPKREKPKKAAEKKPAARAPRKKNIREPLLEEEDDPNDSIASSRPRRACATPSTLAPKRITWAKRDLDKLNHVIELKKPTANLDDWVEVTRLLKKNGVEAADVKHAAETRLKWKEPVQNDERAQEDEIEEERKRRRGVAAKVKEGVRMREEMREGGEREDEMETRVGAVEDYQPDDMDADQSLMALGTPAVKKKGGTRASILPQPVEDSPIVRGNNTSSFMNSPRLDQTKAKEVETTLKYVQHLSTMQARPGSSMNKSHANKSYMNKSTSRGGKNTSISVEQGTRRAMKIVNRGTTIEEDEEEDEEENDDDEEDTSVY